LSFQLQNGESQYTLHHTLRSITDKQAEKTALFYAKSFWMQKDAKPVMKGKDNRGWYSPDGTEAIKFEGLRRATAEEVVKELEIIVRMRKAKRD